MNIEEGLQMSQVSQREFLKQTEVIPNTRIRTVSEDRVLREELLGFGEYIIDIVRDQKGKLVVVPKSTSGLEQTLTIGTIIISVSAALFHHKLIKPITNRIKRLGFKS